MTLREVIDGGRFVSSVVSTVKRPVRAPEARAGLRQRFESRERQFLALVDTAIYRNPGNPYRELLALAGCELGDLETMVRQDGIEGALRALYRRGVYLTVDELKGRRPAVRGSATVRVAPDLLRMPGAPGQVVTHSSGSRGARTALVIDLASMRAQIGNIGLLLEARGNRGGWAHANWGVPGSAVMLQLHQYQVLRQRVFRWFSQVDLQAPGLHPRYMWAARMQRLASFLVGLPLPAPEHVPIDDPQPITRWLTATLGAGATPHIWTFPSSAVRLCHFAEQAGLDLRGTQFTTVGEPMTAARLRSIRRVGAVVEPLYGSAETGLMGYGCLEPDGPDDFHVVSDLHGLIQAGPVEGGALRPRALLVTSLGRWARLVLLNASLGDEGELGPRSCGCALEGLGWRQHVRSVRSFEKLNAGGIALLDSDVVTVLEETLPARFGGAPTDYQLVEDESLDGRPRLRLLVHPAIGPLDEALVAETFLRAIGEGSGVEHLVEMQWRQAGLPIVERRPPRAAASGKIRHLERPGRGDPGD